MTMRCLGFVLVALLSLTTQAVASLTSSENPVAVGDVPVGGSRTEQAFVQSSATDTLNHFHLSGTCDGVTVEPTNGSLPATIILGVPLSFDVTFQPQARVTLACTVAFHNGAHASIGTDFQITGAGIAGVIDAPASVSFPARRVTNGLPATATVPVTLRNAGDDTLEISALASSGDFSIPTPPTLPQTLGPAETLVVDVVFDPTVAGSRTGDLTITSDDLVTPAKVVPLSGQGTVATIAVTDEAFGIINLTQTGSQSIAVTNSASADAGDLKIFDAQITGGNGWFTFDANGFGCLGADTCTFGTGVLAPQNIVVRCTPPAGSSGTMTATVSFGSDSDGGDNVAVLSCTAGRADATVDPTSLDFGATVAVGSSVPRTVTVTNGGNINLVFTASKVGARQAEYAFGGCFSSCTVPAGESRQFTLTFTPTQAGGANITVNIASNDPDNGTIPIPVTATSVAPVIDAPAALAFNNVEVTTTATRTLTITNTGTADLVISTSSLSLNDGSYAVAAGSLGAQTVAPGNSTSWDLTCTPASIGAHNGRFTINSNALGAAATNVNLTCTGTEGILVVIPTSIDFGNVPENSGPISRQYRLRNTGNLPVTNIAAVINPANVGYSADPATPFPAQILPGAANEVVLNVLFTPLSGADGGPATMTFSGTWGTAQALRVPPVLSLTGDALTTGFDVMPNMLAYGDLRFDTTATRTFCITNTSQSNVTIQQLTIVPDAGTVTGEFAVPAANIRRKTCGAAGNGTQQNLPAVLAPSAQLEVIVIADPADRVGAMAATLSVVSTLTVNGTRTVALTANSTSGAIALAPGSTVDFGPRDVQAAATTIDIVITNSGDGPLDLRNFARDDNGANLHFALTLPGNTVVQPGNTLTIPVTYTPATVTTPDEQIVLSHQIIGVLGGPASQSITIRGRGIDRDIELLGNPAFPPTFRNVGPDAPVQAITVRNTGEATLRVTAVMLTSDDAGVWTLENSEPRDLAFNATADYRVRFSPNRLGSSTAQLVFTNDDDSEPMAVATLTGMAVDRNIVFDAPVVNLGFTGVGLPITIGDALAVQNLNTVGFTIARIDFEPVGTDCAMQAAGAIDGVDAFAIPDSPTDTPLAMGEALPLAVTFTPEAEGKFVAAARLYVDPDPEHQATICVVGNAVFVDAHGGGGCSTGSGGGLGGALALLALARRRRVAAALAVMLAPVAARADNVVLSIFDPAPQTSATNFQLQSPDVGKHGDWVLSATVSHATNQLVLDAIMEGQFLNDHGVVERSTMFELGGAFAFLGRFEAGARMPLYAQDGQPFGDPQMEFTTRPASGTAMGDATLHVKARLWRGGSGSFGSVVQVTLPTATDGEFTGTEKPSGRALLLGALNPNTLSRRITLTGNVGAVVRAKSRFANLEQGGGATWGLGVSVRASDRLWVAAELYGDMLPSARLETAGGAAVSLSPIEYLGGLRWLPDHRFAIGLAAGRGLTSAAGSPDLRGVLSLTYAPGAVELPTLRKPEPPERDRDGDGIRDRADKCPDEAEDADMFDDSDGCPDLDNDNDGIADAADKCPLDPEDKDGFADDDGCVDKDNDNDGLADGQDRCPNQPEDKDGYQDVDGCPDPDNDGDGIPDDKDKCPEPETINGNKDDDGCPDPGDSTIVLSPDRIETLDAISFTGGAKLAKPAFNVLGQVAATMRAHPEIVRMRVTVHVQPSAQCQRTGECQKDQDLSDQRAHAIRDWLVQWGVDGKRVEARGFGGTKPITDPSKRGAATLNERVELIILERK